MTLRVGLVDPEAQLLTDIADAGLTRDDVAATCALALNTPVSIDWKRVNLAIIDRWSISALRYIKDKAWRLR